MYENSAAIRFDYMRYGHGLPLSAHVGHRVMELASQYEPSLVEHDSDLEWFSEADNPSGAALGLISKDLSTRLFRTITGKKDLISRECEITPQDMNKDQNKFRMYGGLGDLDTTIPYTGVVADGVVSRFEAEGLITSEQRIELTPGDWATMIKKDWFHTIMHELAMTDNGIYEAFGANPQSYRYHPDISPDKIRKGTEFRLGSGFFDIESRDSMNGRSHDASAKVSGPLRERLLTIMKQGGSSGCPVARHRGVAHAEAASDHHMIWLTEHEYVQAKERKNGEFHFTQKRTPIDVGIDVLADYLAAYDVRYGSPVSKDRNGTIVHEFRPMTKLLMSSTN